MSNVLLTFLGFIALIECGPFHASCKIDWTFSMQCSEVENKLVTQINAWQGFGGCGAGEKCGYKVVSQSSDKLKATHTTPVKHYVDDLEFTFTQDGSGCKVHGYSTAETWYAVLDYGTNYCNLRNLIEGAGLDKTQGFSETTSNSVCTQFSSHNCTRY